MTTAQKDFLQVAQQLMWSCREICLGKAHMRASLLLIGQSLELLLKSELVSKQVEADRIRKEFGHDIKRLLSSAECAAIKGKMTSHAEGWARELESRGMEREPDTTTSRDEDFWAQIDLLADAHSHVSGYALRYPRDKMKVPIPVLPYLVVQNCIWDRLEELTGVPINDDPLPTELQG